MLINKLSGVLELGTEAFFPHMGIVEFRKTKAGSESEPVVNNPPWQSYRIRPVDEAAAILYFRENRLHMIAAGIVGDSTESWETWTIEAESKKKLEHDKFLRNTLGIPPYVFSWGEVSSVLDEKSASASIIIRYSD